MEKTKELIKIESLLEQSEIYYAKAVYSQLEDHVVNLNQLLRSAKETLDIEDFISVANEVERTAERTEDLFNLGESLLRKANGNINESLKQLRISKAEDRE